MQQTKKMNIKELERMVKFDSKDFVKDIFHLLKVTKDEKTCEQALTLIRSFVSDENSKFYSLVGLEALTDIPEDSEAATEQAPAWIMNSFIWKLTEQMIGMDLDVKQNQ